MSKPAGYPQQSRTFEFMKVFTIPDATDPSRTYLKRLRVVQTPWFSIYVHWIYLPDQDRDPHDHPWPFASLVLRGGYTERVHYAPLVDLGFTRTRARRRFSLHRTDTAVAHVITELKPNTVTLLLVGRRCRQWGFWTADGWVAWNEYDRAASGPDPFGLPA